MRLYDRVRQRWHQTCAPFAQADWQLIDINNIQAALENMIRENVTSIDQHINIAPPFMAFAVEGRDTSANDWPMLMTCLAYDQTSAENEQPEIANAIEQELYKRVDLNSLGDYRWLILVDIHLWRDDGGIIKMPVRIMIPVAGDGSAAMDGIAIALDKSAFNPVAPELREKSADVIMAGAMANTALLFGVLTFLNCRNVEYMERWPSRAERRRLKREDMLVYKYHTLHLKSNRNVYGQMRNKLASGLPKRFHLRRGHFKTYTDDAPLMGKHTGTFYWESAAVSSKKRGIIDKDYQLEE